MTIISRTGPAALASRPGALRGPAGIGFSAPAETLRAEGSTASAAASEISLTGLLALHQDEAEPPQDRRARRHGRDMLEELNGLHLALLGDSGGFRGLRRLAALAADIPQAADPRLRAALAEIAVRARVELARYGAE
jgi:hypothetical protein